MDRQDHLRHERALAVARALHTAFCHGDGIFGHTYRDQPEDILPHGMERGSYEHRMFLTLTISIDYMRDADQLWKASRRTFEDEATRYLFDPRQVVVAGQEAVARDLARHGLSLRRQKDAEIWYRVCSTLHSRWGGDPLNLVEAAGYSAEGVRQLVAGDQGFYYLRGRKISSLWIRALREVAGIGLRDWEHVPIPADVHIVRATFTTGVVGPFRGTIAKARKLVAETWSKYLEGSGLAPLDLDEPLWHLSRYGCRDRPREYCGPYDCPHYADCPVAQFCVPGKVHVRNRAVEVEVYKPEQGVSPGSEAGGRHTMQG